MITDLHWSGLDYIQEIPLTGISADIAAAQTLTNSDSVNNRAFVQDQYRIAAENANEAGLIVSYSI